MDTKFLEFWGNLLINAAQNQKQADSFFRWTSTGKPSFSEFASGKNIPGFPEMTEMFQKLYGLDKLTSFGEERQKMTQQAFAEFQKSLKEYLTLMGIVSKDEHLALVEKYEELKSRCAEQEETIKHLKMLLNARGTAQTDMTKQFETMVTNQGKLFQNIIKDIGLFYPNSEKKSEKNNPKEGEKGNDQSQRESDPHVQTDG
jgi:hypothetical protein